MSLETRITALAVAIAGKFNERLTERGALASLSTTDKTSIVNAINELATTAAAAAVINDAGTGTADAWSATKIASEISTAIANLVDSAPGALDTLNELATAISGNDTDIAAILTNQANRVAVDIAQTFSAPQQLQARQNIDAASATDVGDTDRDFVADFTGALTV